MDQSSDFPMDIRISEYLIAVLKEATKSKERNPQMCVL